MTRRTLQTSAAILVLMVANSGCSLKKVSWWPWGNDDPAQPKPVNQPTRIIVNKTKPPDQKHLNIVPGKTNPARPDPIKPVEAQNSVARFKLAETLDQNGRLDQAVPYYRDAANENLPAAQYTMGLMHATGEGLPADDVQAAAWFRKAADQGLPEAQQWMGIFHETGRGGLPKNFKTATDWFRKAANQGWPDAQYHMGYLHAKGQGVPKELAGYAEAAKWFLKAAENGVPDAQFQIGVYYARGDGVEQNMVEAYKWLTVAKLYNHKRAEEARAELEPQISSEAVGEGIILANKEKARQNAAQKVKP